MIPHHQQAVEMAQLAADRAERQEVKDLAARVEAAQAPEIARLEGWLGEWGEDLPMEGMDMDHGQDGMGMMSDKDMSMLASDRGAEFDRQFLEVVVGKPPGGVHTVAGA